MGSIVTPPVRRPVSTMHMQDAQDSPRLPAVTSADVYGRGFAVHNSLDFGVAVRAAGSMAVLLLWPDQVAEAGDSSKRGRPAEGLLGGVPCLPQLDTAPQCGYQGCRCCACGTAAAAAVANARCCFILTQCICCSLAEGWFAARTGAVSTIYPPLSFPSQVPIACANRIWPALTCVRGWLGRGGCGGVACAECLDKPGDVACNYLSSSFSISHTRLKAAARRHAILSYRLSSKVVHRDR